MSVRMYLKNNSVDEIGPEELMDETDALTDQLTQAIYPIMDQHNYQAAMASMIFILRSMAMQIGMSVKDLVGVVSTAPSSFSGGNHEDDQDLN